ncbi:transcriptional regulator [Spirochaetia bacterium]|nr:transcriptional regulator [Spirochaetia bacterium]
MRIKMNDVLQKNINLPIPVIGAVRKLGQDMGDARRRRRITMALMAERAGIAVNTLAKIEKGDPGASMAAYASVLFVLGLTEGLRDLADAARDSTGRMLEEENLPQRVRYPRKD